MIGARRRVFFRLILFCFQSTFENTWHLLGGAMRVRRAVFGAANHLTFYQKCKKMVKVILLLYYLSIFVQYDTKANPWERTVLERKLVQTGIFPPWLPAASGPVAFFFKDSSSPSRHTRLLLGNGEKPFVRCGNQSSLEQPTENIGSLHGKERGAQGTCLPYPSWGWVWCCHFTLSWSQFSYLWNKQKTISNKMYIRYLANSTLSISITENIIILITRQPLLGQGWVTRKQGLQARGCPRSRRRLFLTLILSPLSFS